MNLALHKWVANVIPVIKPTQYTKIDNYKVKSKIENYWEYRFLIFVALLFCLSPRKHFRGTCASPPAEPSTPDMSATRGRAHVSKTIITTRAKSKQNLVYTYRQLYISLHNRHIFLTIPIPLRGSAGARKATCRTCTCAHACRHRCCQGSWVFVKTI